MYIYIWSHSNFENCSHPKSHTPHVTNVCSVRFRAAKWAQFTWKNSRLEDTQNCTVSFAITWDSLAHGKVELVRMPRQLVLFTAKGLTEFPGQYHRKTWRGNQQKKQHIARGKCWFMIQRENNIEPWKKNTNKTLETIPFRNILIVVTVDRKGFSL